jgi:hypothetical protein
MKTTPAPTASAPAPAAGRSRRFAAATAVAALALVLLVSIAAPAALAAEQRDRIQLIERPRDAFALVLYGTLGLITVAGLATLRRQLKGEREQTDGEFRWR